MSTCIVFYVWKKLLAVIAEKELGMGDRRWRVEFEQKYRKRQFGIKKIQIQKTSREHTDVNPGSNSSK